MDVTPAQIEAGHTVYTRRNLAVYDLVVLGISNRLVWRCPTSRLLAHYDRHVSENHLDVGVGTGYFLDRCRFPASHPRVALMDLNDEALLFAAQRIARYEPETYQQNILEPITAGIAKFDSVGINYLLHCLPGTLESKVVVFDHLRAVMNPGAMLFGATLLQGGVSRNLLARQLMNFYNRKSIFSNVGDNLSDLEKVLDDRFEVSSLEVHGCVALFAVRAQLAN